MNASKHMFCNSCFHMELRFSSETGGDYGFTVNEFLLEKAPNLDALLPGTSSQSLYLWLMKRGGCLNCLYELRKMLDVRVLDAANETLRKDPKAKQKLDELHQFIEDKRKPGGD